MKYLQKITGLFHFKFCTSFYLVFSILTIMNIIYFKVECLFVIMRVILYCILCYKGVKILHRYGMASKKNNPVAVKKEFRVQYRWFRTQVALWWIAFIVICGMVKHIWKLDYNYFFFLSFFLLALDLIFVNVVCLLKVFSDPKAKVVKCCCGCPVRGWDLLMINTPLLFAYNTDIRAENLLTVLVMILAIASFIRWEQSKYYLVEIRNKCKKSCELQLCVENRVK